MEVSRARKRWKGFQGREGRTGLVTMVEGGLLRVDVGLEPAGEEMKFLQPPRASSRLESRPRLAGAPCFGSGSDLRRVFQ